MDSLSLSHQGSPVLPDLWSNGTSLRKYSVNSSGLLYNLFQVFILPCIFISYYLRKMVSDKHFFLPLKVYHKIFALFSEDKDSVPGLEGSPREGNGNLLQCFCLGNPMNKGVFVGKLMSFLINSLSSFVIVFPPRSKHLLISWL